MKKNTSNIKKCLIKNCPAFNICDCANTYCMWKKMLEAPRNRSKYVRNKLGCCLGYSTAEKNVRYEELDWCVKEFLKLMDVEVLDGNYELD